MSKQNGRIVAWCSCIAAASVVASAELLLHYGMPALAAGVSGVVFAVSVGTLLKATDE